MGLLKRLLRDESGASAMEYGLIAAGIAITIMVVIAALGEQLKTTFTTLNNELGK